MYTLAADNFEWKSTDINFMKKPVKMGTLKKIGALLGFKQKQKDFKFHAMWPKII